MFKEAFKYYKNKENHADLSAVITISDDDENLEVFQGSLKFHFDAHVYGLLPMKEWKIYRLKHKTGLILIKNPFTTLGQRYWIVRCLKDFSRKPYKLNIDAHNYIKEQDCWWEICHDTKSNRSSLLNKLRWATLGYHHNWDTKIYDESSKGPFPNDLSCICRHVADVIGYSNFSAEAAIVNYYHMNSTLSGHTDHSENDLDAPLISISFGQSAIFLIGGHTEDCAAMPILINSGDIIIMSKETRLCYHAVPRILTAPTQPWNNQLENNCEIFKPDLNINCQDEVFWQPFNNYIKTSRININVRQVLKFRQKDLNDV